MVSARGQSELQSPPCLWICHYGNTVSETNRLALAVLLSSSGDVQTTSLKPFRQQFGVPAGKPPRLPGKQILPTSKTTHTHKDTSSNNTGNPTS